MSSLHGFTLRPCVISALELLGTEAPRVSNPAGLLHRAIGLVAEHFREGSKKQQISKRHETRLLVMDHDVVHIAVIGPGETLLFEELLDIVHLQAKLLTLDVQLRGAITIGEATPREEFANGPGLSEAQSLRDSQAEVPRVIVDPRLLRAAERIPDLRASHHSVPMELGFIRDLLREDADGLWYVDYLRVSTEQMADRPACLTFLEQHRELIERMLKTTTKLDRTSRGLTWLHSYHNRVIDEFTNEKRLDEAERSRLRIPATSPLVYAFPPSALKP